MMHFPEFHTTAFMTEADRREVAALTDEVRQKMIKNLLFPYPQFEQVYSWIERFHMPIKRTGIFGTGEIGGLIGDYRSGKSIILHQFAKMHPPVLTDGGYFFPVIYIEGSKTWEKRTLSGKISSATGKIARVEAPDRMKELAFNRLVDFGVRLILIDDFHSVLTTRNETREYVMAYIKDLADLDQCNVLLAGAGPVEAACRADKQIEGRGGFPNTRLRRFNGKSSSGRDLFRLFLNGVDRRLPFAKPSNLAAAAYVDEFLEVSGGSIGFVMNVVRDAALFALDQQAEKVFPEHLTAASKQRQSAEEDFVAFSEIEPIAKEDAYA